MSEGPDGHDSVHGAAVDGWGENEPELVDNGAEDGTGDPGRPDESEPDPAADPAEALAALAGSVDGLAKQLQAHHDRAQARERVIDQLHAEVERLRAGEQGLLLRPLTADLQRLRDDLLQQAATLSPQVDRQQAAALLESFALSVELTLERCGSVPIRPQVGDHFSVREHRAVKLLPAASPEQDATVAVVVADGYRDTSTERITAPARVHVWRWIPPEEPRYDAPVAAADRNRSEQQECNTDV